MTAAPTTYGDAHSTTRAPAGLLKRVLTGAAAFDAGMGIACLAVAGTFGDWLSVSAGVVRATGGVFLVAAAAGVWTARRTSADVRAIVAANAIFSVWCLLVLATDGPNAIGAALLVVSAIVSAATALLEHRLARR